MIVGEENTKHKNIFDTVGGGFLPKSWKEALRKEAIAQPAFSCMNNSFADSWILDRMIEFLLNEAPIDPRRYDIVHQFAERCGYPKIELDRSIDDHDGLNRRKQKRQSPPFDEMIQDSKERAIATIQSIYLVGISAGEITPEQDRFFVEIAHQGTLGSEELKFIIRYRNDLGFAKTKIAKWNEEIIECLDRFLDIEPDRREKCLNRAKELRDFLRN